MDNILYTDLVNLYDIIADDREFHTECTEIVALYQLINKNKLPTTVLELFAGPAYHCEIFEREHKIKSFAIDSSAQMKALACNKHHIDPQHYVVGTLPDALNHPALHHQSFDIVLLMRYALGLIKDNDAEKLLHKLVNIMSPGALVVMELHDLNLLFGQFKDLKIKQRERYLPETQQTVSCVWPSGPLQWNKDAWEVTMPIQIELTEPDGRKALFQSESEERIFTAADVERMIRGIPLKRIEIPHQFLKKTSHLIILKREHYEN